MSEDNGNGTTTLKTKWFELTGRRTSEIITVISLVSVSVLGYAFYQHEKGSEQRDNQFIAAMKDFTIATKEGVQAQRVMNCLLTLDQKDRQAQLSTCERIAR